MTKVSLLAAALISVTSCLFAQVNRYTVTEIGTLDNGGNATGNQQAVHSFEVPAIATSKIRVLVSGAAAGHSRIVEVEAWEGFDSTSNVALASRGATATASSTQSSSQAAAVINGDGKDSGWIDGTPNAFPDWLQIDFSESRTVNRIYVHTAQENLITAFQVQYWNGSAWVDLPNIAQSRAFKINNAGVVVGDSGYAAGPNNQFPFQWQNGLTTALGGFAGSALWAEGTAYSINNAGVITGSSRNPKTGQQNPFQWTAGAFRDLGAIGSTGTWAYDINDAVQIIGTTETDPKLLTTRAWIWSSATGKVLIPLLPRGTSSSAAAINNLGHVVGYSNTSNSEQHAFLNIGSTVTDLGTLGGPWSTAQDINDAGLIVGASRIDKAPGNPPRHAFSSSASGRMTDLGTLRGGIHSWAFGVNNAGVIVGNAHTASNEERAFVYDTVNGMRDLNALTAGSGWTLQVARSINSGGQIVGWGLNPAGIRRAFLLTPNLNGTPSNQAAASNGATTTTSADSLLVTFAGKRIISAIHIIAAQDARYQVQFWDGVTWVNFLEIAPGNKNVRRTFSFTPLVTNKIRVINGSIVELEVWGTK